MDDTKAVEAFLELYLSARDTLLSEGSYDEDAFDPLFEVDDQAIRVIRQTLNIPKTVQSNLAASDESVEGDENSWDECEFKVRHLDAEQTRRLNELPLDIYIQPNHDGSFSIIVSGPFEVPFEQIRAQINAIATVVE